MIEESLNYSKLLSSLINEDGTLNEVVTSFLYQLFPRDLFVRAFSLLESTDLLIYILDTEKKLSEKPPGGETQDTKDHKNVENDQKASSASNSPHHIPEANNLDSLINACYEKDSTKIFRLIVQQANQDIAPFYVDLEKWFCSCDEYAGLLCEKLRSEKSLAEQLINHKGSIPSENQDDFAKIRLQSDSVIARHDKIMCPHLLAFAILLQTSQSVLRYFTKGPTPGVFIFTVAEIDDWLKLHLNVV
ncbi:HGL115Cp [Eremothecium sinecaudum]|uniref:HGL115Cp n=1 Tax=Eremothecium sinecaudum TaxID=45286 RepID=A0A0X8HVG7_9SACH|nr:HGL115Cp [Eremothecium sinecaudum]AMD22225.1 HGL115Cp [Eremothecium sinecaudum]